MRVRRYLLLASGLAAAAAGPRSGDEAPPRDWYFGEPLYYAQQGLFFGSFVERYPFHRASPDFSLRVIGIYEAGGFPRLAARSTRPCGSGCS
jgi:hypothetical protein